MKPDKPILPTEQDIDDWKKIGEMLRWMKARVGELSPFVTNQAPTRDLQYYLHNACEKWEAAGGIPQPEAMPVEAPDTLPSNDEPCHKRGPKTDSFLRDHIDKDCFVEKLRSMILKRFRPSGKSGIMEVGHQFLQELEPSKYFACLFAALIAYEVAKSNATPKGFDRLIKEAIAGTELQETFRLHYTSYNIVINDWMKLCTNEYIQTLKGRQRALIPYIKEDNCNGKTAKDELRDWRIKYSYVADNAREDNLSPEFTIHYEQNSE